MDMLGEGFLEDVRWLRPGVMADSQCTHISRPSEEQVALVCGQRVREVEGGLYGARSDFPTSRSRDGDRAPALVAELCSQQLAHVNLPDTHSRWFGCAAFNPTTEQVPTETNAEHVYRTGPPSKFNWTDSASLMRDLSTGFPYYRACVCVPGALWRSARSLHKLPQSLTRITRPASSQEDSSRECVATEQHVPGVDTGKAHRWLDGGAAHHGDSRADWAGRTGVGLLLDSAVRDLFPRRSGSRFLLRLLLCLILLAAPVYKDDLIESTGWIMPRRTGSWLAQPQVKRCGRLASNSGSLCVFSAFLSRLAGECQFRMVMVMGADSGSAGFFFSGSRRIWIPVTRPLGTSHESASGARLKPSGRIQVETDKAQTQPLSNTVWKPVFFTRGTEHVERYLQI
ncbi:hypothetical protein EYF80_018233 [Liparis tanakae]|uniref:Uncharacterized protein n=1 Tax=Liparis tanakae TaxID=230148 RepID=A0A4Z2I0R5_9TELE|nr:hypothetical protein EYF80_018233 [Liparis tanakae]